jgi:hypothetical protein
LKELNIAVLSSLQNIRSEILLRCAVQKIEFEKGSYFLLIPYLFETFFVIIQMKTKMMMMNTMISKKKDNNLTTLFINTNKRKILTRRSKGICRMRGQKI